MNPENKSRYAPKDSTIPPTSHVDTETPQISGLNTVVSEAVAVGFTNNWNPEAKHALRTHIKDVLTATGHACKGVWNDVRLTKEDTRFNLMVRQEQFLEVFTPKSLVEDYQVDSRMAPKGIRAALEQSLLLLQHNVTTFAELQEKRNKKGLYSGSGLQRKTKSKFSGSFQN